MFIPLKLILIGFDPSPAHCDKALELLRLADAARLADVALPRPRVGIGLVQAAAPYEFGDSETWFLWGCNFQVTHGYGIYMDI